MTDEELQTLLKKHRNIIMTDEERFRQRCSFVYGNLSISRHERGLPEISREEVERVAREMDAEDV
ncbi:hypothetical protein LCGC14_0698840 [marine sediment metagenome]|uniref:Uncharacterized protein n=1 Tax=marine sediment metagenome TaxID=412755 RepID=A0A0F9QIG5_9ZZZZ